MYTLTDYIMAAAADKHRIAFENALSRIGFSPNERQALSKRVGVLRLQC
jgi:hypothetical protein